jgi:hypothetical protein
MNLSIEIDGYQEDQIVGVSLKECYQRIKSDQSIDNRDDLIEALKCVYNYYTGKALR